jgi:signal transduction histidine kinase
MEKSFNLAIKDMLRFAAIVVLWLTAYVSAGVFDFFETYASLWFLPAGVTLGVALTAPRKFLLAPLVANLLLAIPFVCAVLGIEFTNYRDPILHGFRLYVIYSGVGLAARYLIGIELPISDLKNQLQLIAIALVAALLGALSGVSLHATVGNFSWSVAWEILLPWAVGDAIGTLIPLPILVPFLMWFFDRGVQAVLPGWPVIAFQLMTILLAMFIAFWAPSQGTYLDSLFYLVLLPPVVFAVRGGLPSAATAIVLTALLTPPAANWFGFEGERISLQVLLLMTAISALMIGGAISDREVAFDAIKQHEADLEEEVANQTKDLRDAFEFQQHLIRSIGHDLRQPMHSVNMMLDGLVIEHKDTPAGAPLEQARAIGQTASGFIDKVLAYAKREAGRIDVISEEFALQRVFDQVVQTFEPEANLRGVTLHVIPTNHQMISDANLVWEAVSNLVQNAVQMSEDGLSVTVRAEIDEAHIAVQVVDEIQGDEISVGQAGFGLEIVRQIARMLDAKFSLQPNLATIEFSAG